MTGTSEQHVAGLGSILVVLPTYNEARNLERTVGRVRRAVPAADILVTDDASPDGTGQIADRLAAEDPQVHVLHRAAKEGLGTAYKESFAWGLARGYDVLCEMDADGSHQPEELAKLLAGLADADLVIGSRWVPGGRVENWSQSRELLSRGANRYAQLALGVPLRDATAGFRAFRRATLEGVGLDDVASLGYCFQIDLAWRALQAGFRVTEVPIVFREREFGDSKMDLAIMMESFRRVAVWGIRHRLQQVRGRADGARVLSQRRR
ncbi:glycosyltransferase [Actinopolymorpha rutila]|uniref:Glycosyltransferase involved in cell wall biosynthesis n=1 Tax=Actinopolymorpha rutila TaxID=446787 RepID=A0A852ZCP2_9ACTN|nr:glycosyltransferase involved in cell wall biosynthesis [Actinopolymorpha rutila]